ncbi:DUF982 domain-containing protein, partial [Agrobacterium tumefaciens]
SLMGDVAGEIARTAFVAASRQAQCLVEEPGKIAS